MWKTWVRVEPKKNKKTNGNNIVQFIILTISSLVSKARWDSLRGFRTVDLTFIDLVHVFLCKPKHYIALCVIDVNFAF